MRESKYKRAIEKSKYVDDFDVALAWHVSLVQFLVRDNIKKPEEKTIYAN